VDISGIFKNNPGIKYLDLCFFPEQVETIAPYLRNLTSVCMREGEGRVVKGMKEGRGREEAVLALPYQKDFLF
jgi:hypothetical protein